MSQKITKTPTAGSWLLSVVKTGLWLCLFMPLVTNSHYIFPFIFPKQAFFQIVLEITFALYLLLALKQPQFRPRSSLLFKTIFFYFAIMFLSMVFGVSAYHSFWSNFERMAGFVNLIHYLGFLFVAVNVFKTQKDWFLFFDISIIVSVLEALYSFGQLFGIAISAFSGSRLDGTIGNSSFLAGYMLINSLFALWLFFEKKNIGWRIFYALTILLELVILYETQTRGALLALFCGLFILLIFFLFAPKSALAQLSPKLVRYFKMVVISSLAVLAIFVSSIFIFHKSSFIKSSPTLLRFSEISLSDTTSQTRLLAWKMSLKGFTEHPLFGWGPENYNILFNQYYDPQLYPTESWFDRAHNAFLDVLVNTGLFGMIFYLGIFILSFYYLWRAYKEEKIKYFPAAILTVVLISYGIQNIFVFDTQITLLMFYLILSFVVYLSFQPQKNELMGRPIKPNFFAYLLIIGVIFFVCYAANIKPAQTSTKGVDAIYSLQALNLKQATEQFNSAFATDTFGVPEVANRAYDMSLQIFKNSKATEEQKKEAIKITIDGLKLGLEKEPKNARFMMMLGNLYLMSVEQDASYLQEADAVLGKALLLSPTRQELLFSVGQLRIFQGRTEEALALFKKAVELNETVAISHWNYGIVSILVGQKEIGEQEIKKAVELGHAYEAEDISFLINSYGRTNDLEKIVKLYQDWIKLAPKSADPWAGLAAAYQQMGNKTLAKQAALKAIELDPSFKEEGEQFIKELGI